MTRVNRLVQLVCLGGLTLWAWHADAAAASKDIRAGAMKQAEVTFLVKGRPGFLRINGTGGVPVGTFSYKAGMLSGTVECPMGTFVTGIDLRDKHMKEKYLEVEKYPKAVAELQPIAVDQATGKWADVPFKAWLTLHGVRKEVSGVFTVNPDTDHSARVEASFGLKISDFGISLPSYAGITVAEDVVVTVHFHAEPVVAAESGVK
jgi:hypothetical protein